MSSPRGRTPIDDGSIQAHFDRARARSSEPAPRRSAMRPLMLFLMLAIVGAGVGAWSAGLFNRPTSAPVATGPAGVMPRTARVAPSYVAPIAGGTDQPGAQAGAPTVADSLDAVSVASRQEAIGADLDREVALAIADPARTVPAAPGRANAAPAIAKGAGATSALESADKSALFLAGNVLDLRRQRATHLRWLDHVNRLHLVDEARAAMAKASTDQARTTARIQADNLGADIHNHSAEARRLTGLRDASEQRLARYCADHHQLVPVIEQPPETWDGSAGPTRPLPQGTRTATGRSTAAAGGAGASSDPFSLPND